MAKVLPAPVSPVINQPRQKSFRSHLKLPIDTIIGRFLASGGVKQKLNGKPTKNGRKLSQPTMG